MFFSLFLLIPTNSNAAYIQRINSLESEITVNEDSTLSVRDEIQFNITGKGMRRPLYKDFPTLCKDKLGKKYIVSYEILDVLRDDKPISYRTKRLINGWRLLLGKRNSVLPAGKYAYTIRYKTSRQISFFKDRDELFWNVTGNGWSLHIQRATATVILPGGANHSILESEAFTGDGGAGTRSARASHNSYRDPIFRTGRRLNPKEKFTIYLAWPKGFVDEPRSLQKTLYFMLDKRDSICALLLLVLLWGYYMVCWNISKKPPEKHPISRSKFQCR